MAGSWAAVDEAVAGGATGAALHGLERGAAYQWPSGPA